jgi:hypothetical protein
MSDQQVLAPFRDYRLPWYAWPLVPVVILPAIVVLVILAALFVVLIPFSFAYPDYQAHPYDLPDATARQRELIALWRSKYRRLNLSQRIGRALAVRNRRRRSTKSRAESALMRNFRVRRNLPSR